MSRVLKVGEKDTLYETQIINLLDNWTILI